MKQDKQPRRASKNVSLEQLHPSSDMNARAAGGDKESNEPLRRKLGGGEAAPSKGASKSKGKR